VAEAVQRRGDRIAIDGVALPASSSIRLLAAGKAAVPMATAFLERAGERLSSGLVVTKDGHGGPLSLPVVEAGHPVPDGRSEVAGAAAIALVEAGRPGEVLVALLSGGASALLSCPQPGLTRAELASTTSALLACGAPIGELNAVRKHLTRVSGGRLARMARARRTLVLALSDVPGDEPSVIASGPFHGDATTHADALAVLDRHGLRSGVPDAVLAHLEAGARGEVEETPAPGDPIFAAVHTRVLASNRDAAEAAVSEARAAGVRAERITEPLSGEAREVGARLARWALQQAPGDAGRLFVAGGETTVRVRGDGRGGRSQELALAAALALEGAPGVTLLAAGTDGTDGPTPAAGAFADSQTVARAREAGVDARTALARNDSYGFFRAEGGSLITGPTGTNVMDLVLILRGEGPNPPSFRSSGGSSES
jgi:glycerate-2-kinase